MPGETFHIHANIVDLPTRSIAHGRLTVENGVITSIGYDGGERPGSFYLIPGFVDAHIHIESSMLTPPAFAKMAVRHGTVATVSDPHEIANVSGIEGVRYMVQLGNASGFRFYFGAPSCVPATSFETAGATLTADDIKTLFEENNAHYLAEMMNFPAVLARDPLVMDKIAVAQKFDKLIDGHAPGLRGDDAKRYAEAGISTDHECTMLEEALDKIETGMKILIREGSAAKNYDALHSLLRTHPDSVMFCSDDKHPDDLIRGHMDEIVRRSVALGYPSMDVLHAACVAPVRHYQLEVGLIQVGDTADMILVNNLREFHVQATWIQGVQVYDGRNAMLPEVHIPPINTFSISSINISDLQLSLQNGPARIIKAIEGAIVTDASESIMTAGDFEADTARDILKIVVVNRYRKAEVAIALIQGFGLKKGAIASSVAHDSHNIVAVGTNDQDLCRAINLVIESKGGVVATDGAQDHILPLPVAGLMSPLDGETVGHMYEKVDRFAKAELGSTLHAPFMTLSFMALLVIPSLKLSDLGLFDGKTFAFTRLQ